MRWAALGHDRLRVLREEREEAGRLQELERLRGANANSDCWRDALSGFCLDNQKVARLAGVGRGPGEGQGGEGRAGTTMCSGAA